MTSPKMSGHKYLLKGTSQPLELIIHVSYIKMQFTFSEAMTVRDGLMTFLNLISKYLSGVKSRGTAMFRVIDLATQQCCTITQCTYLVDGMDIKHWMTYTSTHSLRTIGFGWEELEEISQRADTGMQLLFWMIKCIYLEEWIQTRQDIMTLSSMNSLQDIGKLYKHREPNLFQEHSIEQWFTKIFCT